MIIIISYHNYDYTVLPSPNPDDTGARPPGKSLRYLPPTPGPDPSGHRPKFGARVYHSGRASEQGSRSEPSTPNRARRPIRARACRPEPIRSLQVRVHACFTRSSHLQGMRPSTLSSRHKEHTLLKRETNESQDQSSRLKLSLIHI